MSERNLPGGEMSSRILDFFWIADCSGSMNGEKIQTLNYAIRQTIPDMRKEADDNPNASIMVRAIKFSDGAAWHVPTATDIENFNWTDLTAGGVTAMGMALELVAGELKQFPTDTKRLPPVLVLLTDGQPTDDFKKGLEELLATPWGKKAVRIAIAIGKDVDLDVLEQFAGNKELVLEAKNPQLLVKFIKWASTVVKNVSAPSVGDTAGGGAIDINTIPTASADDDDIW
ncbi:MAG: VWA domain-containing protein [Defluviitaleaceae bacterium]|nr:VWA domain-containing protein [Defluviitaleaceae bacterium]